MTGMKRRLAAVLAGMVLFSCAAAPAEDIGRDTVDIQESLVTREYTDATLEDHFLQLAQLVQKDEVRNLLKIEDVSTIATEVVWKVLVWMWHNRPVTVKILAEFGVSEPDLRNVEMLWDSAERIIDALRKHGESDRGKRLSAAADALFSDEEFRKSMNSLQMLLTSEDVSSILQALQEVAESDRTDWQKGPLTEAALEREMNRTGFAGSLLLSLFEALDRSGWAQESLPGLLTNEKLWQFLLELSEGDEELDRVFREEILLLTEDPEMNAFLQRTLSAGMELMNTLRGEDAGGENGTHPQEETEVPAP